MKKRFQLRCCICGRFMSEHDDICDASLTLVSAFEEAEPEIAHRSCVSVFYEQFQRD